MLACTLAATLLTRYEHEFWVVVVAAAAAALTSWTEYSDVARKTERYTRAAYDLQNVHTWWKSLSNVEKASKVAIARLIQDSENVMSEERLAWMSSAEKQGNEAAQSPEQGGGHEADSQEGANHGANKERGPKRKGDGYDA